MKYWVPRTKCYNRNNYHPRLETEPLLSTHMRSTRNWEQFYTEYSIDYQNASLILTCGFQELGTLRNVICWKIHIPVRTPKWLPRLIFCRGMSQPVNWYRDYVIKACDTCDMTCEHVSRQGKLWSFFPCALDLSVSVAFYTASFFADFKQYLTGWRLSYLLRLKL